jgi:hypothetical protein
MTKIQDSKQKTKNSERATVNGLDVSAIGAWDLEFEIWDLIPASPG